MSGCPSGPYCCGAKQRASVPPMTDTTTATPAFDKDAAVFIALSAFVAGRDNISVDEAAQNLANLFNSPEVQEQVAAEQAAANAPQEALNAATTALSQIQAAVEAAMNAVGK